MKKNSWRWGILMALYLPLISIPFTTLTNGKELRPSDHGLPNGAPETAKANSPEMSTFFGDGEDSTTQPLPEARNFSDPAWSGRRVGGEDHARKVLMVSSLVCGVAGIVLLGVAGFVFLNRVRNHTSEIMRSS